jgi:hypothetical protein
MPPAAMNLDKLKQMMRSAGATQLYLKVLADNDDSKHGVYLGRDLTALNILPNGPVAADSKKADRLKSPVHFSWLDNANCPDHARHAQLILYPQYPEVRLSGFLRGCKRAPSELMNDGRSGRILFLGITAEGHILGFATSRDSSLAREIRKDSPVADNGVFTRVVLEIGTDDRGLLLSELARISRLGWIRSKRLEKMGSVLECNATNCGGFTLEAELGIRPNSYSDPDFHGWEIKQHSVTSFEKPPNSRPITLMTPEPTGGVYVEAGIHEFLRRYGYDDRKKADRRNFSGTHKAEKACKATTLTLVLDGYDSDKSEITDLSKGITLFDPKGITAAVWHYKDLIKHWTCKHALAAYVPSTLMRVPYLQYRYSNKVRLGVGTEFRLFLNAVASGAVYYDPGVNIEDVSSSKPKVTKRSQFRITSSRIPQLYTKMTTVDARSER